MSRAQLVSLSENAACLMLEVVVDYELAAEIVDRPIRCPHHEEVHALCAVHLMVAIKQ